MEVVFSARAVSPSAGYFLQLRENLHCLLGRVGLLLTELGFGARWIANVLDVGQPSRLYALQVQKVGTEHGALGNAQDRESSTVKLEKTGSLCLTVVRS